MATPAPPPTGVVDKPAFETAVAIPRVPADDLPDDPALPGLYTSADLIRLTDAHNARVDAAVERSSVAYAARHPGVLVRDARAAIQGLATFRRRQGLWDMVGRDDRLRGLGALLVALGALGALLDAATA